MSNVNKIKGVYPMSVDEIVFTDGTILEKKIVVICGDFLVVEGDDRAPDLYNMRFISELRRVEEIRPQARVGGW